MFRSRALPFDPRANKIASLQSLKFHHGGLYEDYVSALNRGIADTPIQNADLFTIITQSFKQARGEECEFSQISKLYQICLGFSRIFIAPLKFTTTIFISTVSRSPASLAASWRTL